MPNIRIPLVTNEYYHIFNRGVARQPIFLSKHDYQQAMLTLSFYQVCEPPMKLSRFKELPQKQRREIEQTLIFLPKRVELIAFVFMPNHFHFLIKQTVEKGITSFMNDFTNSYTRYFNTRHERVGPILQGIFKAVYVETEEQLMHLSRYIHINPPVSYVIPDKDLFNYPWSSLPMYLGTNNSIINPEPILQSFHSKDDYKSFLLDQVSYAKELDAIKHLTLDDD